MGHAFEVITGRRADTALAALTVNAGDSFTVRSFPFEAGAWIEGLWAHQANATAGVFRVRSPRLHDNVQGIRKRVVANEIRNYLTHETRQHLFPQDQLVVEASTTASDQLTGALAVFYNDLPGIQARLVTWDQIQPLIRNLVSVEVTVVAPTTAGDWSAGTAITTDFDLLKTNVEYAITGYEVNRNVAAVAIRGSDTGNLRVGGPGPIEHIETRDWFVRLSRKTGLPHIPVINAANKDNTLAFVADRVTGTNTILTLQMAELRAAGAG
jgi:hypothetical protein